jgi:hypothetical protein
MLRNRIKVLEINDQAFKRKIENRQSWIEKLELLRREVHK